MFGHPAPHCDWQGGNTYIGNNDSVDYLHRFEGMATRFIISSYSCVSIFFYEFIQIQICRGWMLNPGCQTTKIAEDVVWFCSMMNPKGDSGIPVFRGKAEVKCKQKSIETVHSVP